MKIKSILIILFFIGVSLTSFGQSVKSIEGQVQDENGEPLIGVNVYQLNNESNGVITDYSGNYQIKINNTSAILVFSYIGYLKQEIVIKDQNEINVVLEEESQGLDEVVITALGIKKDAKALGYSVSKVDNDRILASGTPVNPLQSLYGSAAGVQVAGTASGQTGGMKINIRNAVSFDSKSTTRPLIVVDGIPIHDENTQMGKHALARDNGTGINDINPDDIASFEILKGAKASVLYGSEGANGVVLITTKSGVKNKGLGVSASFTTTWDKMAFTPDLQRQYGTGRSPSAESTDDQGFALNSEKERILDHSNKAFGPKYDPNIEITWWDGTKRKWTPNNKDIFEQMFRIGRQNTTNIALSNADDKTSFRFSYTNMQLKTITPGGELDKNTFSVNFNRKLNDFISVKYTGNFYFAENLNASNLGTFAGEGGGSVLGAYAADIDVDLIEKYLVTDEGYNYFSNPNFKNGFSQGRRAVAGFFWGQTQDESIFKRNHFIHSLSFDIKLNKYFSANVTGGMDNTQERNEFKGKLVDPSAIGPSGGTMYLDELRNIQKVYGQALLNFNYDYEKFNFSGFVGTSVKKNYIEKKGAHRTGGMVIPNWFSFANLPSGQNPNYQFGEKEDIMYSILGSAQIAYNDELYFEFQGRQDWSSILPPDNNKYFYPGISATWLFTETLDLPEFINFGKLRTSWADVGRPGPIYFSNVNFGISQSGGGYIINPPDDLPPMDKNGIPNLKPERKREIEFGLETYLFKNNRLGLDFAYFSSNTYDQIMAVSAPPGMGVKNIRMNAGDVSNKGWELAVKTKPIKIRDFEWNLDLTFAQNKTKIEKLGGGINSLSLWSSQGINAVAEIGGEYGILYQTQSKQKYINPSDPNDPNNGKYIVSTSGNRYEYSAKNNKKVGKLLPDLTGGLFTSFVYKNWRLLANFDYQFGGTFISESETYMMASGILKETLKYRDKKNGGCAYHLVESEKVAGNAPDGGTTFWDGVLLDGVNAQGEQNTKIVSADDYYYATYFANNFFPEDRIFKSDYVALRNIAIDYKLPNNWVNKYKVNDVTLSFFINNVAYLYKDAPNTIPESTNGTGWSDASYGTTAMPAQRSIGGSLKLKF